MPSVTCFKFRFTPNWYSALFTVVFCILFCLLGMWQLARADEKRNMVAAYAARESFKPVVVDKEHASPLQYQSVSIKGHFLSQNVLLDNQHHDHQFGYDVLTPVELADGSFVIVDRGWVKGDVTRRTFPEFKNPPGLIKLSGSVYYPSNKQWVLGASFEEQENKTLIAEQINLKLLSQVLQKKLYPFIIRLDKANSYGFIREWSIVSMPPERHLAYAVQWFAFAFVTLILFVVLNIKKRSE